MLKIANELSFRDRIILLVVMIACLIGIIFTLIEPYKESAIPISAQGMSAEEREVIDINVISEELADFQINEVSIDYSGGMISVYSTLNSDEQYIENYADEVIWTIKQTLNERLSELTLEKDRYTIILRGADLHILKIASV